VCVCVCVCVCVGLYIYIYIYISAVGPTQPPVKWVPGLSRGKVRPRRAADHSPPSIATVMEE